MGTTVIIGGGAAGITAAIAAAELGQRVTVLERNAKTLKKLGVTGNGRGNLLSSGRPIYYGNAEFAQEVLEHMPYAQLVAFFERLGVPLREDDEGRVYPAALQASVVAEALRLRAEQLGVQVCLYTRVRKLTFDQSFFTLYAEEAVMAAPSGGNAGKPVQVSSIERKYRADRVIVTVGGKAAPAHGTDGTGYELLLPFGHTLVPPRPALCALCTEKKPLAGLAGQRVKAVLILRGQGGSSLHSAKGEALFAEDGVSGIAAMQLARFVEEGCRLSIDLRPSLGREGAGEKELLIWLKTLAEMRAELSISNLCTGLMAFPLSRALMKAAGITDTTRSMAALSARDFAALAHVMTDFSLVVTGVRGFDSAQVTAGGIAASEFSAATLESHLQRGLYAAGEVLDVDGDCGGYNLMFAFASGLLSGRG